MLKLWKESFEEKLDTETKSRIIYYKKQMEAFKFYFGLQLGCKLYAHTENLSKTLQQEKMSPIKGKSLADLTIQTLKGIRSDRDYNLFYESIKKSGGKIKTVSKPTLPQKRNTPNYSILQFVKGHKSEEPHHPETTHTYLKAIYNETIDTIINSFQDRFDKPRFKVFGQAEQLFLKPVNQEDHSDDIMTVESTFRGDYNHDSLITKLQLLPAIFDDCETVNFGDIVKGIQLLSSEKHKLIRNVVSIARLVLTNGARSATPERSFSTLRQLKTWLRSTMNQKRFNSLTLLNEKPDIVDKMSLIDVVNEFVALHPSRLNTFGKFTDKDLS